MLSRSHCKNEANNDTGDHLLKSAYQNPSILQTYEDKLYRPLTTSKQPSSHGSHKQRHKEDFINQKLKRSIHTASIQKQCDPKLHLTKIREIKCLKCSCLTNVRLVEQTEDIIDSIKDCCHRCGENVLVALSYKKKNYQTLPRQKQFSLKDQSDLLKQCVENASNFLITDSPPYQRRRAVSLSGGELSVNIGTLSTLQPSDPAKLTFLDCVELSNGSAEDTKQTFSHHLTVENHIATNNSVSINPAYCSFNYYKKPLSQRRYSSSGQFYASTTRYSIDKSGRSTSSYYLPANKDLVAPKMKSHAGKKPVRVHLLNGDSILLVFGPKAHVKEVFDQVCTMHSIKESHFFGLSAIVDKEHRFMDLKQRLSKYAPKEWGKELKRRGSDLSIQPSSVFTIQFQVQYYIEHPKLICNYQSRQQYYLQLKRNVLQCKVPTQDETIITLAATALHLDMGPFDPVVHTGHYFEPNEYVPAWFMKKWDEEYLWSHLPSMHKELYSTSAFCAQADYIKLASTIEDVPVHYYKLFKTKSEAIPSIVLGIFHQGIRIHHVAQKGLNGPHLLDFEFPWSKVGRLFFASKRFEIYPEDLPPSRKLIYFTGSRSRSKYLLRLLRDTHSLYTSLTPFVQHMRRVDGKTGTKRYRESYISGMNLEERLIGGVEERLIGGLDKTSPDSHSSKEDREKLSKFYNSSTSHGSSHTSGIESDSKQRPEDAVEEDGDHEQIEDNAFVDDFDPIEVGGPPIKGGVIMVTQQHLNAPPHKNLSVNNLTEVFPRDAKLVPYGGADQETASNSETARSESTIRNEDTQRNAAIHTNIGIPDEACIGASSVVHRCSSKPSTDSVLLAMKTNPLKTAHLKEGSFTREEVNLDPKTHERSGSLIPDLLDAFPDVPRHRTSDAETETVAPVSVGPQPAFPVFGKQLDEAHQRQGSHTIYDDTHTFLPQQRNQSVDMDAKCMFNHSTTGVLKPFVCPIKDERHHQRRHKREAELDSNQIQRSFSTDSVLHKQKEKSQHSKPKTENSRHHRNKSMHDAQGGSKDSPDGKYFGGKLVHNKSVEDLSGSTGTLSRSERKKDIPQIFNPYVTSTPLEELRQPVDISLSAPPSKPRAKQVATDPHVVHHRKMSDICHQTIAAQQQKISGHRKHRHAHEHRRHSEVTFPKPSEPSKANGHAIGAAGYTPRKTEVVLRSREKTSHNRYRPVSYHMTGNGNNSHDRKRHSCLRDAAINTNSLVYIESFKEVIV